MYGSRHNQRVKFLLIFRRSSRQISTKLHLWVCFLFSLTHYHWMFACNGDKYRNAQRQRTKKPKPPLVDRWFMFMSISGMEIQKKKKTILQRKKSKWIHLVRKISDEAAVEMNSIVLISSRFRWFASYLAVNGNL